MELPAVRLPNVNAPEPVAGAWSAVQRRLHGTYVVDEWGCDTEVLDAVSHLAKLRWQVSIGGAEHVPPFGPAVLVCNTRPFTAMPLLMALALHLRTGRAVRVAGVPDIAPFGPALRRIGGVLSRSDEVAGLLRAGHVVTVEPGLYYLGLGGVRIEDVAVVKKSGSRCLTRVPKLLEL